MRSLPLLVGAAFTLAACSPAPSADTPAGSGLPATSADPMSAGSTSAAAGSGAAAPTAAPVPVPTAAATAEPAASATSTSTASAAPTTAPAASSAAPVAPLKTVSFKKDPYWYDKAGGLTLAQIKKALPAYFPDLARCDVKGIETKVGLQLKIEPSGSVSYSYASGGMDFSDCAQAAAKKWTFPTSKKQSEVVFDVELK